MMTKVSNSSSVHVDRLPENRKLVDAAHEFEAQMMKELLKPMSREADEESDSALGSRDGFVDLAAESLGRALSNRGGVGIADRVLSSLSQSEKLAGRPR